MWSFLWRLWYVITCSLLVFYLWRHCTEGMLIVKVWSWSLAWWQCYSCQCSEQWRTCHFLHGHRRHKQCCPLRDVYPSGREETSLELILECWETSSLSCFLLVSICCTFLNGSGEVVIGTKQKWWNSDCTRSWFVTNFNFRTSAGWHNFC